MIVNVICEETVPQSTTSSASLSSCSLSIRRLCALTFFAKSLFGLQSANRNDLAQPAAGHLFSALGLRNVAFMAAAENECPQTVLWNDRIPVRNALHGPHKKSKGRVRTMCMGRQVR